MYSLVITKMRQGRLETTRAHVDGWPEVLQALKDQAGAPCKLSLSDTDGSPLLYLMVANGLVHLSAWGPPDHCHYLMTKESEQATGVVDVGWDAYPAWSVVTDIEYALRAAELFVEQRVLADWGLWREEVVEL